MSGRGVAYLTTRVGPVGAVAPVRVSHTGMKSVHHTGMKSVHHTGMKSVRHVFKNYACEVTSPRMVGEDFLGDETPDLPEPLTLS